MIELIYKSIYMWFDSDHFDYRVDGSKLFVYYYDSLISILSEEFVFLRYLGDNEIIYKGVNANE